MDSGTKLCAYLSFRDGPILVSVSAVLAYRHYFTISVSVIKYCRYLPILKYHHLLWYTAKKCSSGTNLCPNLTSQVRCSLMLWAVGTQVCHRMCENIMTNIIVIWNLTISCFFQSLQSARSSILVSAVSAKASIDILAKIWYRPIPTSITYQGANKRRSKLRASIKNQSALNPSLTGKALKIVI